MSEHDSSHGSTPKEKIRGGENRRLGSGVLIYISHSKKLFSVVEKHIIVTSLFSPFNQKDYAVKNDSIHKHFHYMGVSLTNAQIISWSQLS